MTEPPPRERAEQALAWFDDTLSDDGRSYRDALLDTITNAIEAAVAAERAKERARCAGKVRTLAFKHRRALNDGEVFERELKELAEAIERGEEGPG